MNLGYNVCGSTQYPITVGGGGAGSGDSAPRNGGPGSNSVFGCTTATGGGGGAGYSCGSAGLPGGSGGGARGYTSCSPRAGGRGKGIFAPKDFSQHRKHLSSSTGVVPLLKLKSEFPDYNPTMIAKFLTHLEFCFKVDDHETLDLLKDGIVHEENIPQSLSEEFYFFPALVNIENPLQVWEQDVLGIKDHLNMST